MIKRFYFLLLLCFMMAACSSDVYWNDGNYTVYKCCGQNFYALGYEINGNGWEGLIDNVAAVGSNNNHVIIKTTRQGYFVVKKVTNNEHWRNRELKSRRLTKAEFMIQKETFDLPEFTQQFN